MPRSDQQLDGTITGGRVRYPALSVLERLLILGVAVTQFLIGHGRVWAKPFDWDRSIVWSYATIAVLVPIALSLRQGLNPVTWLLHTVELAGVKFLLTAGFLLGFLITHPQGSTTAAETSRQPAPSMLPVARAKPKPKPTVFPEGSLGEIEGRITGVDRKGVRGALVFVSDGLSDLVFEPPAQPIVLENDGVRFSPSVAAVQVGQPLVIRSANHQLHTLQMMKQDRSWVLNVPMLASGDGRRLEFEEAKGLVSVECKVHQAREGQAHLAILNHPFFAISDPEGRFVLRRVPPGTLIVSVFDAAHGTTSASVQLKGGAKVDLSLQLGER